MDLSTCSFAGRNPCSVILGVHGSSYWEGHKTLQGLGFPAFCRIKRLRAIHRCPHSMFQDLTGTSEHIRPAVPECATSLELSTPEIGPEAASQLCPLFSCRAS